jgi:peptidoglycan/LPS O-acetylase OafA/YrhL
LDLATSAQLRPELPFFVPLQLIYTHGASAVEVFWAISGFIFYWRYADWIRTGDIGLWKFAVNRFSRLYPLHLATLIAVAVLQFFYLRSHGSYFIYGDNTPQAFLEHLFFASNWLAGEPYSFNGPVWSVSVEVLVYMVFFFIALRAGGRPIPALVACIGAFAVPFVLRTPVSDFVWECSSFFFAGGLAYWLWRKGWAARVLVTVAAIMASAFAGHVHLGTFGLLLSAMWLVLAFACVGKAAVVRRLSFLGDLTYSSYLVHFPIQLILVQLVDMAGWGRTIFSSRLSFVFYLLLIDMVSLALYHAFERPAQNWLRRLLLANARARAAAEPV